MKQSLKIDFVSDVSCPWCAVGLGALEQALAKLKDEINVELKFQPFELNPQMGPEGQDIIEHLTQKYGSTAEQQADMRDTIRQRGAEVGFEFGVAGRGRIWNTFDAHRLLHLAEVEGAPGQQEALKKALLAACHTRAERMSDHAVLTDCAKSAGLNDERVIAVLDSDEFTEAVRDREAFYHANGIQSVPAVIINETHLISGGQPVEVFENAFRQVAQRMAAAQQDEAAQMLSMIEGGSSKGH